MIKFLYYYNIPTVFVLTKADKLSKSAIEKIEAAGGKVEVI